MAEGLDLTVEAVTNPIPGNFIELILYFAVLYITAFIFSWLASSILQEFSELFSKDRVTIKMLIPLVKIFFYGIATIIAISTILSPSYGETIAFVGLFGAALGFGLKDLFANIIGGIVIILERPYQIGDKITVGDDYGEVLDIGLRTTRIKTPSDDIVTLPNYLIFSGSVSSGNYGKTAMMVVTDLYIDNISNYTHAQRVVRETVASSPYVIISSEFPYTVLIESFPIYRRIRAKAYVNDHRYEFEYRSDLNRRAWDAMKRDNIKAPSVPVITLGTQSGTDLIPPA